MPQGLLKNNREWAARKLGQDPDFFARLSRQQEPRFLWIGCSDSRVPANEIVGLDPGELFVHRNVANLAMPTDINFLSVLAYAVNVLRVSEIVVCGHYGCGGIQAALRDERHGVIDHWLEPVREVCRNEFGTIDPDGDSRLQLDSLCEANVKAQVANVAKTTIVQDAWTRGQTLNLHGWIYGIADGLLRDLEVSVSNPN